jgi:hypothetical protein
VIQRVTKKLRWMLSNLYLFERNLKWWRSGLSLGLRLSYYPAMAASFAGLALRCRRVRYLRRGFVFDNAATPMNLQIYPYEVGHLILRQAKAGDPIRSVLDVGGNLEQLRATFGEFDILAQDAFDHRANNFDIMLRFFPAPTSLEEPTAIREAAAR